MCMYTRYGTFYILNGVVSRFLCGWVLFCKTCGGSDGWLCLMRGMSEALRNDRGAHGKLKIKKGSHPKKTLIAYYYE